MSCWISQTATAAIPDDSDARTEVGTTGGVHAEAIGFDSTFRVHGNDRRSLELVTCKVTSTFVCGWV